MAVTIGILVGVAVLQILQRDGLRIVIGLYTFWNAANLLIIAAAAHRGARAPFIQVGSGTMADPLVQALVLTAIVISFGFTAFLVTLAFWLAHSGESIDVETFRKGQE